MDLAKVQELVALAGAADLLDNENVQTLITTVGVDYDEELASDAKELLSLRALGKLTSPDPFYPLPAGLEVDGYVRFGKVGNQENHFGLNLKEMTQHVLLAGRSGSGKTNLLYHMMGQLHDQGINFWCFDFKREFRGLMKKNDVLVLRPDDFRFNPLRPPEGISPHRWISIFCDVFSHSTRLLEGSNSFLLDQVFRLYDLFEIFNFSEAYPSFHELVAILQHVYIPLSSREARYLESVRNRLISCVITAGEMLDCDRGMMDYLMETDRSVIFEFYGISEHVSAFLIEMILAKLYFYRMAEGRKKSAGRPLVVFMDEGRNVYDYRKEKSPEAGIPIIDTMTERIRDFGVSFVICSQIPSEICVSAKSNTYTKLMMSLGNGKDIMDMAACMGLNKDQASACYSLEVGSGIVKMADRYTRPFWIKIPYVPMEKDVPDFEVDDLMEPLLKSFDVEPVSRSAMFENHIDCLKERGRKTIKQEMISDIVREMLSSIFRTPYVPVSKRYETLGLSRKKGKVVKDFLVENKLATEANIKISNSIYNFLVLSKKALSTCERMGYKSSVWTEIVSGKVSFRHRFYQFFIKNHLTQEGWEVNEEATIGGNKRVDIEAIYGKKKLAIEIAVSKFELNDVMKCINDGFDEVRVVCKNETMRKKIEGKINGSAGNNGGKSVLVQTINGLLDSMPRKT